MVVAGIARIVKVRGLRLSLRLSGPPVKRVVATGMVVGVVVATIRMIKVSCAWLRLSLLHFRSASGSHQEDKHLEYTKLQITNFVQNNLVSRVTKHRFLQIL